MVTIWDESMETGNEVIDAQHREVVGLLDELDAAHGAPEADVLEVLARVMDFTAVHFEVEKRLMADVGYPPVPTIEMLGQHGRFKNYARLRVLEFRESPTGRADSPSPLGLLAEWLEIHEFGMDRALADWIRSDPNHESAVE